MNCEEYREAIAADPAFDGGASHVAGCSGCEAYQREMQSLNLKIAKAMLIDVPELKMPELPDVDTSGVTPLPTPKRSMKPVWFAIAATVVLATSISVRMSGVFESNYSLADDVLAHIDHEPGSLRATSAVVSDDGLARAVPASSLRRSHPHLERARQRGTNHLRNDPCVGKPEHDDPDTQDQHRHARRQLERRERRRIVSRPPPHALEHPKPLRSPLVPSATWLSPVPRHLPRSASARSPRQSYSLA